VKERIEKEKIIRMMKISRKEVGNKEN